MEEVFYPDDQFTNKDFYDVAILGGPLRHIVSNISIKVYQGNTTIDLMGYFELLKTGRSNDIIVKDLILCYCKLLGKDNFANVDIINEAFAQYQIEFVQTHPGYIFEPLSENSYQDWCKGSVKSDLSKITTNEAIERGLMTDHISTYSYQKHLYPDFDPTNYGEAEIMNLIHHNLYSKFNIPDYVYLSNNIAFMNLLSEEQEMITDDMNILLDSNLPNMFQKENKFYLRDVVEILDSNTNQLLTKLSSDIKIMLYVAIININLIGVSELIYEIDPRIDNNHSYHLALEISEDLQDYHNNNDDDNDHNLVNIDCILNMIKDEIIIRNWYEKEVLTEGIDRSLGYINDIGSNLYQYTRKLF